MSPRRSSKQTAGLYRKPRADVYTFMLLTAMLAIVLSIVVLYLHMQEYKFELKGNPPPVPSTVLVDPLPAGYCPPAIVCCRPADDGSVRAAHGRT